MQKKRIKLGQYFPISRKAASQPPTKLDLKAGRKIRIEHAILGLVTKSANDAAMVLAEGIGGSETRFVRMMNQKARRLGMMRTTFRNPSGLPDDDQVTTARDLATLANALIRDYPKYYPYFSRASFTYQGIEHPNHNRLMEIYQGMDGLKTGYIRASGFNLAASAVRDGRRLIAVVMGGDTPGWRDEHMAELMDQGFATPRTPAPLVASLRPPAVPARKPETGIDVASLEEVVGQQRTGGIGRFGNSRLRRSDQQRRGGGTPEERGGWGIQVGAFSDADAGRRALDSISRRRAVAAGVGLPSDGAGHDRFRPSVPRPPDGPRRIGRAYGLRQPGTLRRRLPDRGRRNTWSASERLHARLRSRQHGAA